MTEKPLRLFRNKRIMSLIEMSSREQLEKTNHLGQKSTTAYIRSYVPLSGREN